MPRDKRIKKVVVIGSGPIVIGQAAEFDYAGAQACRVLKKEGINVVLINSNPATIMTDSALADEIYLEPLTLETVERIIEKEKPDSILASLGGQTGLTLAMQMSKNGFLESHNIKLLGTNAEAISRAEDRQLFKETMESIGQPLIPSEIANDVQKALEIADEIGYPVIIRPAFTLGGTGGGVAYNKEQLNVIARTGLESSPINQVLVEKYLYGWKEIEFEVMRDSKSNVITVCSMENVDPVGIHTGDSIVVAPTMTLSNKEFQMLRTASLNIISALGIVGGCNCQFALDPNSMQYAVIEVNPRVSRSSALASKATGYPIAKITTLLALGYNLDEIKNEVTGKTSACFEPAVDYVVVKFPKWPFDKLNSSNRLLGTQMKATGEVMAIASSFEAAMLKAVRGAEISKNLETLNLRPINDIPVEKRLAIPDDRRIFSVFEALKKGISVDDIYEITKIDKWFLYKLNNLAEYENDIGKNGIKNFEKYLFGKKLGYTDKALKELSKTDFDYHIDCSYKLVDTCAAEFEAETPYFYSGYYEECEAKEHIEKNKKDSETIIVLGSGPIRIGQGIEFDYSSVHCVWALKSMGYDVVIINNNPETVSTDYDTADRLYFEPLCGEDVLNIIKVEKPIGVVVAFGGNTAINLVKILKDNDIPILGTSAEGIDLAEDREKFDNLLERFNIRRPMGAAVKTIDEALAAVDRLHFPVLLRPSYVIGGQNMTIAYNKENVIKYMQRIFRAGIDNPVLIDKYMPGVELEVDVISDGEDVLIPGIMEHIERAGVHSGDSIAVFPPFNLNDKMLERIIESSNFLAISLGTKGLVNIQYLIFDNELYVIEVNPRASRTIPYISKVTKIPMVEIATRVMLGEKLSELGYKTNVTLKPDYYAVKVPVFSFEKLSDVNSLLGPEMKSTGEVLGVGKNIAEAMYKGLVAAGFNLELPRENSHVGILISVDSHDLEEIIPISKKYHDLGMKIYATPDTAAAISKYGIDSVIVEDIKNGSIVYDLLENGTISYIVYTGAVYDATVDDYTALHKRAVQLSVTCMTSLDTANAIADIIATGYNQFNTELIDINKL